MHQHLLTLLSGGVFLAFTCASHGKTNEPAATGAILLRRSVITSPSTNVHRIALQPKISTTTSDGWTLTAMHDPEPVSPALPDMRNLSAPGQKMGAQWNLALPPNGASPHKTRREAWEAVHRQLRVWGETGDLDRLGIDLAEPDLILPIQSPKRRRPAPTSRPKNLASPKARPNQVVTGIDPSPHWPKRKEFGWHLLPEYSQLAAARESIHTSGAWTNPVRIILLDTGARDDYAIMPENYRKDLALDICDPADPMEWSLHGTSTTAVLAGGRVQGASKYFSTAQNPDGKFEGYVGAQPWAEVTTYRIQNSVVHILSRNMADGITLASDNGADVISISHGGLPSFYWARAVNHAYENGSAIFAASGDFFSFWRFQTPRWVVYPAAFGRVIAVPGVTASYKTYGKPDGFFSFLRFTRWDSYLMRGNYGPRYIMKNAVCGFSPNIIWAGSGPDVIDLDGGGTSAATPQVAAAAALWLQQHRYDGELAKDEVWRSSKKVDAVYYALKSTGRTNNLKPRYDPLFFGCGSVAALDALSVPYSADRPPHEDAELELIHLIALLTDWFDFMPARTGARWSSASPAIKSLGEEALQIAFSSDSIRKSLNDLEDLQQLSPKDKKRIANAILKSPEASPTLRGSAAVLSSR